MVQNAYFGMERGASAADDRLSSAASAGSGSDRAAADDAVSAVDAWHGVVALAPQVDPGLRRAWAATNFEAAARRRVAPPAASPIAIERAIEGAFVAGDLLAAAEDAIDEAKAGAERGSWDERAFEVAALLGEVIGVVRPRAQLIGVELKLDPTGLDLPQVVGDPNRLRRVLLKLINGAIKSRRTGEVSLSLRGVERDHELAVDVIVAAGPRELRRREPARTAPRGRWRERWIDPELSFGITEDLAQVMDGVVDGVAESGFDLAVAMRLSLPTARVEPDFTVTKGARPAEPDALAGLRILVAEDSDLNRELIQMLLAPFGCEIDEATNGQAALQALDARAYDAILMDMNMPVMDGFEATRRIRSRADERSQTPVLAVTGRALSADIAKIRALGASGHLSKPFSTQELVAAILACTRPAGPLS
ncbi:response regulator [Phenylobacterium montanum]|uniref:Response regulator n=1 Tax=Phenylobacterium montanum TaxID=2823693 RepID=A0A975IU21_9CAUL|nr:response regulator [Caulobacter sp. S6]QUD87348.1 response regulator [Caulobacter sp. S6]